MDKEKSDDDNQDAHYVIPEDATKYLPKEWRDAIKERAEDARKVLETAEMN